MVTTTDVHATPTTEQLLLSQSKELTPSKLTTLDHLPEGAPVPRSLLDRDVEELPTIGQIRKAIPAHCFRHSYLKAFGLLARDLIIVAAFGALACSCLRTTSLRLIDYLGWAAYAYWQGSAITGLWVLAHECGHGGFSASTLVNDAVGYVLHTSLLVPYFSWQFSHSKHHAKINHIMEGESHVPDTMDELSNQLGLDYYDLHAKIGDDAFAVFQLVAHLGVGWPVYLLTNATGGKRAHGKKPKTSTLDHFRPWSQLFPPSWFKRVAASTIGIFAFVALLFALGSKFGGRQVALMYIPPYLVCNGWLVLYTWLQHTHERMPHFGDSEWSWVKGALSTIDRPYADVYFFGIFRGGGVLSQAASACHPFGGGGFHDWMHHRIGSTHVFHHLFSHAPCYHAVEATAHLKAFLAPKGLYNFDARSTWTAAWQTSQRCHGVAGVEGAQYMKTINELKKAKLAAKAA